MDRRKQESECTHLRARVLSYQLVRVVEAQRPPLAFATFCCGSDRRTLRADSCRRSRAGSRSLVFPSATFAFAIRNVRFTSIRDIQSLTTNVRSRGTVPFDMPVGDVANRRILLKNSDFRTDHNSEDRSQP
jgi:hypothetical protein